MKFRIQNLAAAIAGIAVVACSSDSTSPTPAMKAPNAPVMSMSVGEAIPQHIVMLKNAGSAQKVSDQVAALGGKVIFMHPETGFALISGLSDVSASALGKNAGVSSVMNDETFQLDATSTASSEEVADDVISSQANPATAARYNFQWNMRLINADDAWAAGKLGSPNVTVAIIDSGIDYDAPDLNGLVDLTRSVSFVPQDDQLIALNFPTRHPVNDMNGHGTNVATQVSSKAFALAGVTSKTTLMGVKVLGFTGSGSTGGVLAGILYAADHGANIANMSLGSVFAKAGAQGFHAFANRVFNYADKKGMVIVVSSGNAATDLQHNGNMFSAYCDAKAVVCVSAVGPRTALLNPDEPAYYTNYGRNSITVAAPGGSGDQANGFPASARPWGNDTRSWVWSYCAKYTIVVQNGQLFLTACTAGNRLTGYVGTSQASPHVAGLLALIMAEGKTSAQAKDIMIRTADKLGGQMNDAYYGRGRIDVAAALGL